MASSTIIMPCNTSGPLAPTEFFSSFGVVDVDWSNEKDLWAQAKPMDCQERLITQAQTLKATKPANGVTPRVFVYLNGIKALPWFTVVREKISDPAYAGWFLHFNTSHPHVPTDNTTLYHDHMQTPDSQMCHGPCDCGGVPCGEYLWDLRNASLRDWLVESYYMGPLSGGNAAVDGLYVDDMWSHEGPSEEDSHAVEDCGLSAEDVQDLIDGWQDVQIRFEAALQEAGKYAFQLLNCEDDATVCAFPPQTAPNRSQSDPKSQCTQWLEDACSETSTIRDVALMFGFSRISHHVPFPLPSFEQDLATFLLVRGPYAWLGYGWLGCKGGAPGANSSTSWSRPPALDVDYGVPEEDMCRQTSPGVFEREWSKASIKMDCNAWEATIRMK